MKGSGLMVVRIVHALLALFSRPRRNADAATEGQAKPQSAGAGPRGNASKAGADMPPETIYPMW